jgi:hypothetical protein
VAFGTVGLIVAGLLPAWKVAQQHLIQAVKDGGHQLSQSLDRALMRRVLVSAQVAGSCVLLIVAGMMVRSVQRITSGNVGFDYENAAVLSAPLARNGVSGDAAQSYWRVVKERVRANPEVRNAALVTMPPLGGLVDETIYDDLRQLTVMIQNVDPEFFDTMKIALIAGRIFDANETGAVIVSRRLALEMYGTLDVVGQRFPRSSKERLQGTIVGIAADAHAIKINATDVAEVYKPLRARDFPLVFLVAAARTDVDRLVTVVREAGAQDPRVIPVAHAMREDFAKAMQGPRITAAIASSIGLVTLGLACLGIFGVVSYGLALRTKEIGIRVALGAKPMALLRVLVRNVMAPVAVGVGAGIVIAVPLSRALRTEPFYLENVDPLAFVLALIVLMLAGASAALWPAIRMLRGNPVEALRHS